MRTTRDFDILILITSALLIIIGLCLIYSVFHPPSSGYSQDVSYMFFNRQLMWVCFAIVALLIGYATPVRYFEALAYVIYAVCVVALTLILFTKGTQTTERWIALGPMRVQPSEFMKIALLFTWGRVLSGHFSPGDRLRKTLIVFGVSLVPFLLVLKQPDLGTAIVFFVMLLPVLYWRGFKGRQIFLILSPIVASLLIIHSEEITKNSWPFGVFIVIIFVVAYLRRSHLLESISLVAANVGVGLILPVFWGTLKTYQQKRILNFLDPDSDKLGAGWQVFQSKIAIGSGGISGKGYLEGTQKALEFLPAKHTDFVFSVLGEEMGFVGAILVLMVFAVLISRALAMAVKVKSQFSSTVCVGIAAYFFFQVFINVAMTTGMAPVTGIPIPFLSYGGSSLVVSCFFIGFLLNCSVRWYEY
ncbi:MAG: rod shape-determining protein RodA [Candidatus Krumholzibacteria bacterium]|nr:rod shape-determining protein RodA [Candidatus Krumholzibacteria bacterium]